MNGQQRNINYEFGSIFNMKNATISASFVYDNGSNIPGDYGIFIRPSDLTSTFPTVTLANSVLASYFSSPYVVSNCQIKGTISYCENFQTTNEGKRSYGYGTILDTISNKPIPVIFTCFIPKESKYYNLLKSCIASQ